MAGLAAFVAFFGVSIEKFAVVDHRTNGVKAGLIQGLFKFIVESNLVFVGVEDGT